MYMLMNIYRFWLVYMYRVRVQLNRIFVVKANVIQGICALLH